MAMDPKLKREWVKALRSGEYERGDSVLCTADGRFCCLGVLADIGIDGEWVLDKVRNRYSVGTDWAYLYAHKDAIGLPYEIQRELANMNDEGRTFEEIADWIESSDL